MDPILGRSQFLSETANLFTDEKTANARARIVKWLNELPTMDAGQKCELLAKIQETIMNHCVELLEEFLEHILTLAHDTNMDVRRQVVGFMEQICKVKMDYIGQIVNVISMLFRDRSPQVIKRVIQACGSIYKNGLRWICSQDDVTDSAEHAWSVLSLIKAQILDLIDNENDGIRTNAIKFLEGVVVLQSYPDEDTQKKDNDFSLDDIPESMKILKPQKLEEEAFNIFDILLKFHAATHISSVNLIACTGSLCTIAKLRPSFMGPVIEAFKNLNGNLPPTLSDSQISSVRKSLKMQLMSLIKNKGSFEFQLTIKYILIDLGTPPSEIQRAIPKMDKQEQLRRQKRILDSANNQVSKRMRLNTYLDQRDIQEITKNLENDIDMEIDEVELKKQQDKSTKVNAKFLTEYLNNTDTVVNLVIEQLTKLPAVVPEQFLKDYTPIKDMTVSQQVAKISHLLGEQMTAERIGPGASVLSKEPPMRPKAVESTPVVTEGMDVETSKSTDSATVSGQTVDEQQLRKEEATKKLRENMERLKCEQELIERMKQRAKTLKLQEITKPLSKATKEKCLSDAIQRLLSCDRQCMMGGVSLRRRHILAVIAATFPDNVRQLIFEFIMKDIKQCIDLAFSWLYEEYCLLQGFTRHSYVKSENRSDYAFNEFLSQLVKGIIEKCEFKDKLILLRRVYMESPLLPDGALKPLQQLILSEEYTAHSLDLLRDVIILKPPRKNKLIRIILSFAVHERQDIREKALEHMIKLYEEHKIATNRIDEFVLEWADFLMNEIPPAKIFANEFGRSEVETVWREELAKICLSPFLALIPCNCDAYLQKLTEIYIKTSPDLKRTILRTIDVPIQKLGVNNSLLQKLIESCPKGCETLIIRIVYILTMKQLKPNLDLVARVKTLYANKVNDVRILIPILNGLTRTEIINALAKLIKLNPLVVREVFNRLLGIGQEFSNQTVNVTPTDILVALHNIDINECDLKCIIKATSICLSEKEIYTQEVLIGVLQQLVEITPIPTLLMRTIIQSLTLYPRLTNFVLNLLNRLILKQVWKQKIIWEGFLKCLQRLKPASLPVMLNLPVQQLNNALQQCPDLRSPLLEYAKSIEDEPMSGITPQIMDILTGKSVDVFITDDTGGFISLENIKKETEEPQETTTTTTAAVIITKKNTTSNVNVKCQPLPPGED